MNTISLRGLIISAFAVVFALGSVMLRAQGLTDCTLGEGDGPITGSASDEDVVRNAAA
jgi:hypothetical protein